MWLGRSQFKTAHLNAVDLKDYFYSILGLKTETWCYTYIGLGFSQLTSCIYYTVNEEERRVESDHGQSPDFRPLSWN